MRDNYSKAVAAVQRLSAGPFAFPLVLAFITLVSFGLLLPLLGFYWDDWPFTWLSHVVPPLDLGYLEVQRPLTGWLYVILKPLLLDSPLRWQAFNLALRWLLGYAMGWALLQVWPNHKEEAAWTAIAFMLYPGFGQQYVSVNTSRHLLPLAMLLFSFGFSARAFRSRNRSQFWIFLMVSTLLSTASMLTTDYYLSLEIIRPILIWIALGGAGGYIERFRSTFLAWLPNLIPGIAVIVWRFFLTRQLYYPIDLPHLLSFKGTSFLSLITRALYDLVNSALLQWLGVFRLASPAEIGSRSMLLYGAIITTVGIVLFIYFFSLKRDYRTDPGDAAHPGDGWWKSALLVGVVALIAGALPAWSSGLIMGRSFPNDRLFLPMMIGASLVFIGLLRAVRFRTPMILVLAVLCALAAGQHFQTASAFRWDWARQKAFFWQLAWRVPGLERGTAILTDDLSFDYETDNSLSAPLNWIYAPENTREQMSLIIYNLRSRPWLEVPPVNVTKPIGSIYREFANGLKFSFTGSTAQVLVISMDYPACLRVVQPVYDRYSNGFSSTVKKAFRLSDPSLIQPSPETPARPPVEIFGPEPAPDWCYYYEKADLARQIGDWNQAAALGKIAVDKYSSTSPGRASEYVLFVEAFGRSANFTEAERLTYLAYSLDKSLNRMLCSAWSRIETSAAPSTTGTDVLQRVKKKLSCEVN